MARIVRFHQLGGPEVLKIEEMDLRQPEKGEVRLQVQAIGLNRAESMFMHGSYLEDPKLPATLGYEAAGIVTAVGPGVDPGWLNKKVSTIPAFSMNKYGMVGDEVIAPVYSLAEYPAELTPAEATSIWMQYLTAYGALIEIGKVKKGEFVLITAASSSVGLAAVTMVKAEGAISIATTRTVDKRDELLALGADHVIVTVEEDLVSRVKDITGGAGVRLIFDPVAGPLLETLAQVATTRGMIVEYGWLSEASTPYPLFTALSKWLDIRAYTVMEIVSIPEKFEEGKKYVIDRVKSGVFRPKIAKTFRFEDVVEAYRYLESNAQIGKVVVEVRG